MNPRQALLDALTAERFTPYTRPPFSPVTAQEAKDNAAAMLAEIEENDHYDRRLKLIMGLGEAS